MVSIIKTADGWVDDTEVQVAQQGSDLTDGWFDGFYILQDPDCSAESWLYLWDAANPDLASDDVPDWIFRLAPPTETNNFVVKAQFAKGFSFTVGLAWFIGETAGDFGDAVTTTNIPQEARVYYRQRNQL